MNNTFKVTAFSIALCAIVIITAQQIEKEDYESVIQQTSAHTESMESIAETPPAAQPKTRTIKVVNKMDDDSLVYKHKTGNYKPKQFALSINDQENAKLVDKKKFFKSHEQQVDVRNDVVAVEYNYEFVEAFGTYRRGGKRRVELAVEETAECIEIDFSFHEKDHITTVKNATIITSYDL